MKWLALSVLALPMFAAYALLLAAIDYHARRQWGAVVLYSLAVFGYLVLAAVALLALLSI